VFKRSVPDEYITALLDAARLSFSCNAQPRFKIVKDRETKLELARPLMISRLCKCSLVVCCADIGAYLKGTVSGIQDLGKIGAVEDRIIKVLHKRAEQMETQMKIMNKEQLGAKIAFNIAIAVEHIVLRALDFGLSSGQIDQ
jgi:hypothetical protein